MREIQISMSIYKKLFVQWRTNQSSVVEPVHKFGKYFNDVAGVELISATGFDNDGHVICNVIDEEKLTIFLLTHG